MRRHNRGSSRELAQSLRDQILGGKHEPGDYLPSVRSISQKHSLAPMTVLKALRTLQDEGLLQSIPRRGFRVKSLPSETDHTGPIACLISDERYSSDSEDYSLNLAAIQQAAAKHGRSLLVMPIIGKSHKEFQSQLAEANVSGVILDEVSTDILQLVDTQKLPVVLLDVWHEYRGYDEVMRDEYQGARLAAAYAIEKGHRTFGWFGPLQENVSAHMRHGGVMGPLMHSGLSIGPSWQPDMHSMESLMEEAKRFLNQADPPDVIFALWQTCALTLARAAKALGQTPGRDIEIIGWSTTEQFDVDYVQHFPELVENSATVTWSRQEVADMAVLQLLARQDDPARKTTRVTVPMTLKKPGGQSR